MTVGIDDVSTVPMSAAADGGTESALDAYSTAVMRVAELLLPSVVSVQVESVGPCAAQVDGARPSLLPLMVSSSRRHTLSPARVGPRSNSRPVSRFEPRSSEQTATPTSPSSAVTRPD